MNEESRTSSEKAVSISAETARALVRGLLAGAAAAVLAPAAAAAGIGAGMGAESGLGIAYWWFWATPDEAPGLGTLRFVTIVGTTIGILSAARRPQVAFWWGALAGTCGPWIAALTARGLLEAATALVDEFVSFL